MIQAHGKGLARGCTLELGAPKDKAMYDMMAVCLDRHSGCIVAVPVQNKGLTGAKVAKALLKYQWRPIHNNIRHGEPLYRGMVENDGC